MARPAAGRSVGDRQIGGDSIGNRPFRAVVPADRPSSDQFSSVAARVRICYDPAVRWSTILLVVLTVSGCAGALASRLTLPERNTLVRDQLAIHSDFPLSAHHRLFEELTAQRADLCGRLALPCSDEPIHVYLFESPERFEGFMRLHHPEFPDRRAFFVETDTRLAVYAQWGDRMAEDLRHEVTHGYLHSVVPHIPLWLDEGIAEFYEVERGRQGLNHSHFDRLIVRIDRERWRPDLRRLDQLPASQSMDQDDYDEAWAWVHFLIGSQPERLELVRAYLTDLRRDGVAVPLSARIGRVAARPEIALVEHLRHLAAGTTNRPAS